MICFICRKNFVSIKVGINHLRKHHNLSQTCTYRCIESSCTQAFQNVSSFKKHILKKHFSSENPPDHSRSNDYDIPNTLPAASNKDIRTSNHKNDIVVTNENENLLQNVFSLQSAIQDISKNAIMFSLSLHNNKN